MSVSYISAALRREVISCAGGCCEYCLMNTNDHGIAEKHGGQTQSDNLSLTCFACNSFKGSDITSIDWDEDEALAPLFNPCRDQWDDHFRLGGVYCRLW